MKNLSLLIGMLFFSLSYSQSAVKIDSDATASYIPPNYIKDKNKEFQLSTGAFFFDATKRMGIYNIMKNADGTFTYKYLGEEQPDAMYETLKDFLGKATVVVGDKLSVDAEVTNLVSKLTQELTNKSKGLNFLRSALYRLNESSFNGDIDKKMYQELFTKILGISAELDYDISQTSNLEILKKDSLTPSHD